MAATTGITPIPPPHAVSYSLPADIGTPGLAICRRHQSACISWPASKAALALVACRAITQFFREKHQAHPPSGSSRQQRIRCPGDATAIILEWAYFQGAVRNVERVKTVFGFVYTIEELLIQMAFHVIVFISIHEADRAAFPENRLVQSLI